MFSLRNKKNDFLLRTLISGPDFNLQHANFNILARPCSRTDWFESYLTPKTGFLVSRSIIEFHKRTLQASDRRKGVCFFNKYGRYLGITKIQVKFEYGSEPKISEEVIFGDIAVIQI